MTPGCTEKFDLQFAWWLLVSGRTKKRRDLFRHISQQYENTAVILKSQKQIDAYKNKFENTFEI
jgi:hypothetical protein